LSLLLRFSWRNWTFWPHGCHGPPWLKRRNWLPRFSSADNKPTTCEISCMSRYADRILHIQ